MPFHPATSPDDVILTIGGAPSQLTMRVKSRSALGSTLREGTRWPRYLTKNRAAKRARSLDLRFCGLSTPDRPIAAPSTSHAPPMGICAAVGEPVLRLGAWPAPSPESQRAVPWTNHLLVAGIRRKGGFASRKMSARSLVISNLTPDLHWAVIGGDATDHYVSQK
jgi:hypothetical protein